MNFIQRVKMVHKATVERRVPWYKFWNPQSGTIGGSIFGTIMAGVVFCIAQKITIGSVDPEATIALCAFVGLFAYLTTFTILFFTLPVERK